MAPVGIKDGWGLRSLNPPCLGCITEYLAQRTRYGDGQLEPDSLFACLNSLPLIVSDPQPFAFWSTATLLGKYNNRD